jgi:hypothetical protein
MARTIFDATARRVLLDRLERLRPESQRRWGKMTPNQMMCHLEDSLRCATGITPAHQRKTVMSNRILRWIIIYLLPWPKGKAQTVKEMLVTQPGEFEADRGRLKAMLEQAGSRGAGATWAAHPAFGDLSGRDYGALIYRHFEHHLRQFGV